MASERRNVVRVIGVVADIRRDAENDYACDRTCIFGLNEEEFDVLSKLVRINPRAYNLEAERYVVRCNPWSLMRILGETFGYHYEVTPLGGRVDGPTGERRTCIWTMVASNNELVAKKD